MHSLLHPPSIPYLVVLASRYPIRVERIFPNGLSTEKTPEPIPALPCMRIVAWREAFPRQRAAADGLVENAPIGSSSYPSECGRDLLYRSVGARQATRTPAQVRVKLLLGEGRVG